MAGSVTEWRGRTKDRLIDGFGGKCNKCGYDSCRGALDFHHLNPKEKSFQIAKALSCPRKWDELVKEARKCILLCNRCHRELHHKLWNIEDIEVVRFVGDETKLKKDTPTGDCPVCGVEVFGNNVCCSYACAGKHACKAEWPSDEELMRKVNESSKSAVARELGVSDVAVAKRLKKIRVL